MNMRDERTTPRKPRVGVIMGSDSDWTVMQDAATALAEFDVPFEVGVISAHRTPGRMLDYARTAAGRGIEVVIAGAGGAAHLPGMVASATPLPVIGVPVPLARPGRHGLAAVHRADARGRAGGDGVDRRRPQRRSAGRAHPRASVADFRDCAAFERIEHGWPSTTLRDDTSVVLRQTDSAAA